MISNEKKLLQMAYRAVRRYVRRLGYKRGKRTGNIVLSNNHAAILDEYLKEFFNNRDQPAHLCLRKVYLDESYIHEHYNRNDDSIWDPNDDQDVQYRKAKNKGCRYCFLAAIQGPNPRATEGSTNKENCAGLVPGSVMKFCPQKAKDSQGDYHKVFDSKNFTAWWKNQLLSNLKKPSII